MMDANSGIPIEFLSQLRRVEVEVPNTFISPLQRVEADVPDVYKDSFNTNISWCNNAFSDGEDDDGGGEWDKGTSMTRWGRKKRKISYLLILSPSLGA